jgi:DNA ligase (NAD+)
MINGFLKWIKDSQRANIFPLRRGLNLMKRAGSDETYNKDRVAYLAAEIIRHKDLYYSGKPEIPDQDFDRMEDELRSLSPDHPVLSVVGAVNLETANPKVTHASPMLSLDKTYKVADLIAWAALRPVMGTLKVDGTSMSLVYRQGKFSLAKTRGNGREGEDVTAKLRWVADAIPEIAGACDFEVRGELYCSESNFTRLSDEMERIGLERPTSPRNIVAGILGRKAHGELARYFNFFAFDVFGISGFKHETDKIEWLRARGYRLPEPRLLQGGDDIERYLEKVRQLMAEDEIGCDGAVFTYNDLALHEELGATSHHPRYKLSFKWQGETARSTITRIEWATSRLGIVTPVAVIAPVVLSGATITNITLHNAAHVKGYRLKAGDTIELVRSGEVIPKFLSVVSSAAGECELPLTCPSCGTGLIDDGVRLKCVNTKSCPAQQSGAILNWIRAVNIEDLSEKRLQQMMDLGLVRSAPDLYRLTVDNLLTMPATKEKMAGKLRDNIQKTRNIPLALFLNGLGIEGAGQTTWEKLIEVFHSLERIRKVTVSEIEAIDGFAERSAGQIVEGLARVSDLIDALLDAGVTPTVEERAAGGALEGMVLVITGALSRPRKGIEDLIKKAGGRLGSSVSKTTSVLITNETDSTSSKMVKAKSLGVAIWDEATLLRKISGVQD